MIAYILAGLIGTTNIVCWGVYGDLLGERFSILKVLRTLFIGLFWSIMLFWWDPTITLFLVALCVIGLERLTTFVYKNFIRKQGTKKYRLPSNIGFSWSRFLRRLVGVALIIALGLFLFKVNVPENYLALILGAGFFLAVLGYTKDFALERLDKSKFFRSPIAALMVGLFLVVFYPALPGKIFLLAVIGGEAILTGFYRKVLRKGLPTKFSGQKEDPSWQKSRKFLLIGYFFNFLLLYCLRFF
jgi:hypothetical protein